MWSWNVASGGFIHTEGVVRLLGRDNDERLASHEQLLASIDPGDRPRVQQAIEACVGRGADYDEEYRVRLPGGSVRWVQDRGAATRADDGRTLAISGILQDITGRKSVELALRASDQRFRIIAENMEDIFFTASPALHRIFYLSPGFERIFGVATERARGDPSVWRSALHPDDACAGQAFIERQLQHQPAHCEVRIRRADGQWCWLFVRSVPWKSADGSALVAGIAADITRRKQANEERVRAAERQRDALVMEVHHRIKNNLQGVLGLLDGHAHASPETRVALASVATRIHSVATVHGLQGRRAGTPVIVCELVQAIAENLGNMGASPLEVETVLDGSPHRLKDRESVPLALILNELVWNALKHSSETPRAARLLVHADAVRRTVVIEIRNAGMLEPRAEGGPQPLQSGSGLGLVAAMMPPQGARLVTGCEAGEVRATLELSAPVLEWVEESAAA